MSRLAVTRVGPLCTIQDAGRFGMLEHGVGASGPMDRGAFERAGALLSGPSPTGIEFTGAGIGFRIEMGGVSASFEGGMFSLQCNGQALPWPTHVRLRAGDRVEVTPGPMGNYGYVRFDRMLDVPRVLRSCATNVIAGLGGWQGRALRSGDRIAFLPPTTQGAPAAERLSLPIAAGPIRVIWGLHAELFPAAVRRQFVASAFIVSPSLDRMGARLVDPERVFAGSVPLSLVSDAVVPGDIQILGDGTPIVLLRDHQPTGGYPRIATVISADLDRFVQLRPGQALSFAPVTLEKAHAALKAGAA